MGQYPLPAIRKALEGRGETLQQRREIVADLREKCQHLRPTAISPIFLGVKQAIAGLRADGCKEGSHCRALVDSDLEENVEVSIKETLNLVRNAKIVLPTPLDNRGIEISFCGLAATTGRVLHSSRREIRSGASRDSDRDDRLREVWRSLFADPAAVSFRPYCPKPQGRLERHTAILDGALQEGLGESEGIR
jgi:hypothetical protein